MTIADALDLLAFAQHDPYGAAGRLFAMGAPLGLLASGCLLAAIAVVIASGQAQALAQLANASLGLAVVMSAAVGLVICVLIGLLAGLVIGGLTGRDAVGLSIGAICWATIATTPIYCLAQAAAKALTPLRLGYAAIVAGAAYTSWATAEALSAANGLVDRPRLAAVFIFVLVGVWMDVARWREQTGLTE